MRDTKQWRRTDRHGYPSCDMCHEAADIIDALCAERDAATRTERARIISLLDAIREHWVKANGADSMSVSALDVIAEVIADGTYIKEQTP